MIHSKQLILALSVLCAAGEINTSQAATIVTGDVTATLWPGGAPYTFFDTAAIGGGDVSAGTLFNFDRDFGSLANGPGGTKIIIRGIGWASGSTGITATKATATITYLGADGVIGGGDDVVIGSVTNDLTFAGASEYVWVFDNPLTNTVDGLNHMFRIAISSAGTGNLRFKTTSGTSYAAVKLSVAGSSAPTFPPDPQYRHWVGNLSGTWDASILNWTNDLLGTVTFANGNVVVLDDTLDPVALQTNIILNATYSPSNLWVSSDSYDYRLSGGSLSGSMSLEKLGSKALTLAMANSYSGGNQLIAGVVRVGNDSALGTAPIAFNGGGLSSDGITARVLSNPLTISGPTSLGDSLNSGALTFAGPANYAGDGRNINCLSQIIFTGSTTNGGINLKQGNGTLTYSGVVGTVSGPNSQWQIVGGDFIVSGGALSKAEGGIRIGNTSLNGSSRLIITNGAQISMTGSGQNVRVGNNLSGTADPTSTNILDVSGTLAWSSSSGGVVLMGSAGAFAQVNLRAGGLLGVAGVSFSSGTAATEFNFLGGTLKATADSATFLSGLGAANINTAAGAIFDSGLYTVTASQFLNDPSGSGGGVIKKGLGKLLFTGGGNYSGATVVEQGTLQIGSNHPLTSAVIVSNSASLAADINSSPNISTLTLNGSGVEIAYGDLGGSASAATGMNVNALNLSGINTVALTGINFGLGTYTVLSYGSKSGGGSFSATPILPPGVSGTLTDTGSAIRVTITATVQNRTWYGFDNGGSFTTTTNWDTTTTAWDLGTQTYANGQTVLFDESHYVGGGDNTNINIAADLSPVAVTVSNGASTYSFNSATGAGITGSTVLNKTGSGRLNVNNVNTYTGASTITRGLLGGTGVISGPVTIGALATLAPGISIGTFTVSNSLTLNGNVTIELDKSAVQTNDVVKVTGALTYGGTLTPLNIGTNALVAGDSFAVFPAGGSGSISVVGAPGTGLNWSFSPASGVLSVVSTMASYPTNISVTVSSGNVNLNWPSTHLGWILQSQTNTLGSGLGTNWVDVPGSQTINSTSIPLSPTSPSVFFRLRKP